MIFYTGYKGKKNGKHTEKEFMDVMKNHHKEQCESFNGDGEKRCRPCKQIRKLLMSEVKKQIKSMKKNKTYNRSKKTEKRFVTLRKKCDRCKKTRKKKCNLKDYIRYSGAEYR